MLKNVCLFCLDLVEYDSYIKRKYNMEIEKQLAYEFNLKEQYAINIINLIDEGDTIPFIARYRKEMHGACDDQVLRDFADRLN